MYISDWTGDGWYSDQNGTIHAVWDPARIEDVDIRTAQNLVREGLGGQSVDLLLQPLSYPDIRIRQRAYLELAARGKDAETAIGAMLADQAAPPTPRLHALWAVGVRARRSALSAGGARCTTCDGAIVAALADPDSEIRRLAARLAGDAAVADAADALLELLSDDNLRIRAQASGGQSASRADAPDAEGEDGTPAVPDGVGSAAPLRRLRALDKHGPQPRGTGDALPGRRVRGVAEGWQSWSAEPDCPDHWKVRRVRRTGEVKIGGGMAFITTALHGELMGLEEILDRI
ncbi:MAG: hypothetical protein FJ260_11640 [Planctomycetes bacterium]|nr:hypothetical protein [Planctomycetota bacterium]